MQDQARNQAGDRAWGVYDRLVLLKPALSLFVLAVLCAVFSYWIKDFRVDASSDTLVLEHDEDVRYFRSMSALYANGDFAVVTYTPPEGLFSEASLKRLKLVREDLKKLKRVSSVVTLLDVPLLRNPPGNFKDLKKNLKTLESPQADLNFAIEEFRQSPIYQKLLVSEDLNSTAILVNFQVEKDEQALVARRTQLREKRHLGPLSKAENSELAGLEEQYRVYKVAIDAHRHEDIEAIRQIIGTYSPQARFFLGGLPMVVDDIMSYIRRDIVVFGIGMTLFVLITLYMIYGHKRWVILPLLCCLAAVILMMGGMGLFHWDVTIVSSNFISLQIILTMSFAIHIVSHYRDLMRDLPEASNHELVLRTTRDTFVPTMYTNLAIISGFTSLIFCDILPVTQFGWIMSMGMVVSMIVVYWLLPAGIMLLPKIVATEQKELGAPITLYFARLTDRHRPLIYGVSLIILIATTVGILRLEVENSFIDYFRKSTEIYQGMKFVDNELGGTTPLDVILKLGPEKEAEKAASPDKEFEMFGEFEEDEGDPSRYWYTNGRLATIEKVHDYLDQLPETGKVLSLSTLHKTALELNEGKPFDDFDLALLYNAVSEQFKSILVTPYVSVERNEARISTRIKDSMEDIRRDELIKRIRRELVEEVGLREDQFQISGLMLLYNNLLQSLYSSQIKTIGSSMAALLIMFLLMFRSIKLALIALLPQALACLSVLGIMGLAGIPLDIMTITIVSIAMGIGVEDAIHYIYRFKEEIVKDHDYLRTMYHCHLTIGNPLFYTSAAVTAGFSILVFSTFIPTILFGLLTGVAMVVACVSSQTLLPALLLLTQPFGPGTEKPEK